MVVSVYITWQPLRSPGLKVKPLVGPTCKIPLNSKERLGNKANLRCAMIIYVCFVWMRILAIFLPLLPKREVTPRKTKMTMENPPFENVFPTKKW